MLSLYVGCMYAGKTSKLIELVEQTTNSIVFDYDTEMRHEPYLSTLTNHNNVSVPCIKLNELFIPLEQHIFINEAQFFKLKPFITQALQQNKHIYVFGLDGDFKQQKFGDLLDIIPLCDSIEKLYATCDCGKKAIFSKRITENTTQYAPHDKYVPVCRLCYIK